jgi:hypothetical protein
MSYSFFRLKTGKTAPDQENDEDDEESFDDTMEVNTSAEEYQKLLQRQYEDEDQDEDSIGDPNADSTSSD